MKTDLRVALSFAVTAMLLSGCAYLDSIHREPVLSDSQSLLTDAKQRIITNTPVTTADVPAILGHINPQRVVCAEPSPDVAQAISQSLAASFEAIGKGSGSLSQASAESVAQLGERLGTVQLLRDKLYRACEAYANGAISATSYTIIMSRLDKTMTTLMLGEMGSGAFGRRLASLGGAAQAGAGANLEDIQKARKDAEEAAQKVEKKKKELEDLKKKTDPKPTPEEITRAEKELKEAQDDYDQKRRILSALEKAFTSALASSTPGAGIGDIAGRSGSPSDAFVGNMTVLQRQYLETDDVATLLDACITSTDLVRVPLPGQMERVRQSQANIKEAQDAYGKEIVRRGVASLDLISRVAASHVELADALKDLPLSGFGTYCLDADGPLKNINSVLEAQRVHQLSRMKADVERARLELCSAVVAKFETDESFKKVAHTCSAQSFPQPVP